MHFIIRYVSGLFVTCVKLLLVYLLITRTVISYTILTLTVFIITTIYTRPRSYKYSTDRTMAYIHLHIGMIGHSNLISL